MDRSRWHNAGKYIRDIGLNSEQLIFRSESGEELKKIVLDILKHTESPTSNLYYLQGRLYDFFSVLTKDVVIDTCLLYTSWHRSSEAERHCMLEFPTMMVRQ